MPAAGGGGRDPPWSPQSKQGPVHTPISNSWPPELKENSFPLFSASQFVVICYGSFGKLIHHPTAKLSPQMYFVGS